MKSLICFGFAAVFIFALLLGGCAGSGDVVDDQGNKVGQVTTTKGDDGSSSTSVEIDLGDDQAEGGPCEWDGDCEDMHKCLAGVCKPVECEYFDDCPESAAACLQGFCMTEDELFDRFGTWTLSGGPCEDTCGDRCKQSMKRSLVTGRTGDIRLCLECTSGPDCVEGYWCDRGKCVES